MRGLWLSLMMVVLWTTPSFAEELKVWEEPTDEEDEEARALEATREPETTEPEKTPKDRLRRSYLYAHYMLGMSGTASNDAFLFGIESQVSAQGFGLGVLAPLADYFMIGARLSYFGLEFGQITETNVAMMSVLPALRLPLGDHVDVIAQFGVGSDFTNFALHGEGGIFVSVGDHGALFLNVAYLSHTLDTRAGSPWEYSITSLQLGLAIGR